MKKRTPVEQWLQENLDELESTVLARYPAATDIAYEYSEAHNQKIKDLDKRSRLLHFYSRTAAITKRAAMLLLILSVISMTIAFSTEAFRETIQKFLIENQGGFITWGFTVDDAAGENFEFGAIYPAYIPGGYQLAEETTSPEFTLLVYYNLEEEMLIVQKDKITEAMVAGLDGDFLSMDIVLLNDGKEAEIYYFDNYKTLSCIKDQFLYTIIADNMSDEDLIRITNNY